MKCSVAAAVIGVGIVLSGSSAQGSQTVLGVDGTRFTVSGEPAFLLGISYYGGAAAPSETVREDFRDLADLGVNWVRVWANWASGDENTSAVTSEGEPREPYFSQLMELVRVADERGIVVDVTLARGADVGGEGEGLGDVAAHCRAAAVLAEALREFDNVYIDMGNERDIGDARFVSYEELAQIRAAIREVDPHRLITASSVGDCSEGELRGHLEVAEADFICPHRQRGADSPAQTEAATREYLRTMAEIGRLVPVHYQEPFRRDYGSWQPDVEGFLTDLRGALRGGAAGWCLHNGSPRDGYNGPARSFDLRPGQPRLMEQLDEVELEVLKRMREQVEEYWQP